MTSIIKIAALTSIGLLMSASATFAQVGGSDIPPAAKAKASHGAMHGSAMKHSSMMRKGSMRHGTMMRSRGKMAGHKTF